MRAHFTLGMSSRVKFETFIAGWNLRAMHELMKEGKVRPVVDKHYQLSEVGEAIRYLEQKHARGKVVITVASHNKT